MGDLFMRKGGASWSGKWISFVEKYALFKVVLFFEVWCDPCMDVNEIGSLSHGGMLTTLALIC